MLITMRYVRHARQRNVRKKISRLEHNVSAVLSSCRRRVISMMIENTAIYWLPPHWAGARNLFDDSLQ